MMAVPPFLPRTLSRLVASYPAMRGQTRLRNAASPWLISRLPNGSWARVSGVTEAEWRFLQGEQETSTARLLKSLLSPGSTFVDVGANVGFYTLVAAALGALVLSYEPTPSVYLRLKENIALNGLDRVTTINAAVSDKDGTLSFCFSPEDPEANSLFGEGERIAVRAVALDDDLRERHIGRVDVLKIDVEGAEPWVLDGAARLLSSASPTLIIEVNPYTLRGAGFTSEDVFDRLRAQGYEWREFEATPYKGCVVKDIIATR